VGEEEKEEEEEEEAMMEGEGVAVIILSARFCVRTVIRLRRVDGAP
jgi:hypothetical protein